MSVRTHLLNRRDIHISAKVEINYDGTNMYYNPTGVDNFGLPVFIGPYNAADCQSGATTGFGTIKVAEVANQCPYVFESTPPFGVCQSPRLVCINDPSNAICTQLDGIIAQCVADGNCQSGTTTQNVWGCNGAQMSTDPKWGSAIQRGIYYSVANGGAENNKNLFYQNEPYNKYAAFIHSTGAEHYAYPYDDYPSTLNEGGYIKCDNLRYMKVQFCPADASDSSTTDTSSTTTDCGYVPDSCLEDLNWVSFRYIHCISFSPSMQIAFDTGSE